MAKYDVGQTTTTNLENNLANFSVDSDALDHASDQNENYWYFTEATQNFGYYKTIPELKKAVDALATWTSGRGFTTESSNEQIILENIKGWGEDSFQSILWNMLVVKKVIGDSFAEIIQNEDNLVNLKPISPERIRIVVDKKGIIKRYDEIKSNGEFKAIKKEDMLHLCNDRIADEIHGISVIDACKWVIDARNEAMTDYRKVLHRNVVPVRIIEIDSDDTAKRNSLITEYEEAIKKGEVLVIPKGTVEIKDNSITIQDPTTWIAYLENFFYQAVGIPKIILGGSQEFTEASSKVSYLTFEQVYMSEQRELESDLWNQLAIKLEFERPVSLKDNVQNDEAANTGQVGLQPSEAAINTERNE